MTNDPVVPGNDGALLRLRVSPNAKQTGLRGAYGDAALKLRVAAPPAGGKANAEIERYVARLTGASGVRIVRGLSARDKTVFVGGVGAEGVREALRHR